MARCTKERAQETRNRILDAAEQVFFEKGVSRTSLADIAQTASVTRGAIYWHFENKSDLFDAMFDRVLPPFAELQAASLDPGEPDPLGRIKALYALCLLDIATDARRRRVFDILFLKCEFVEEMGPLMARYQANSREGLTRLENGLRNAMSKGQLPADLDAPCAARMMHAFVVGALRDMALLPELFDFAANGGKTIEALFDALRLSPALRTQAATDLDLCRTQPPSSSHDQSPVPRTRTHSEKAA